MTAYEPTLSQKISGWWQNNVESKLPPGLRSHYSGLDFVPYDGYGARLHKGERVLTAKENREYSRGKSGPSIGNISITINGAGKTTREMAHELAMIISQEIEMAGGNA
jgi:hypothetical protein